MLQKIGHHGAPLADEGEGQSSVDLETILSAAKRQSKLVLAIVLACMMLAAGYLATTTRLYTASADILIDGRTVGAENQEDTQLVLANSAIDSQVEVVKSQRVISGVIDKLKLADDPEFARGSWFSGVLGRVLGSSASQLEEEREEALRSVAEAISKRLNVTRLNKTFILTVDFTSRDAVKAAQIANAIAESYLIEQLNSKYDATRRASGWLQDRIAELREKSLESDRAVQAFREKNGLIQTNGRLINDQSLQELTTQLSIARSQTALAEARFAQIQSIISSRDANGAVPEALQSAVITDLRTRYLNAAKRLSELTERLGTNHIQVVSAKRELRDYEDQVFAELNRIADSVKSEVRQNKERELSLQTSLDKLVGASASDNMVLVTLREMEREAESYRVLYQSFMQRNQELVQQQTYPVTEARILTRATRPSSPSKPRAGLILALSLLGGLAIGSGIGIFREYRDSGFRTGVQVRSQLGLEFLGIVPLLTDAARPAPGSLGPITPILAAALTEPLSRIADTMRTVKVTLDFEQPGDGARVLGVMSCHSGEGKTMISSNLAMLLGSTGARVLLIDGDLRRCGLSRELAPNAVGSLADVVQHGTPLTSAVTRISDLDVWLLASPPGTRMAHSSEILRSAGMKALIEAASKQFDYIVVDLPPLGALVDARAIEPLIPSFLLVIEWGETPRDSVLNMLRYNAPIHEKCIGTVLNKADPDKIGDYISDKRNLYSYSSY